MPVDAAAAAAAAVFTVAGDNVDRKGLGGRQGVTSEFLL